jgi:hypothetical protein
MKPRIFSTYNIKTIEKSNSADIKAFLNRAFQKHYNSGNKLKLQLIGELNSTTKDLLIHNKKRIISLDIQVFGNEDFSLGEDISFELLESLSAVTMGRRSTLYRAIVDIESLIVKHAQNLKNLSIDLKFSDGVVDSLTVPSLPVLESLVLCSECDHAVWPLIDKCRPSLTSLDVNILDMEISRNDPNFSRSMYRIQNLNHLKLRRSNSLEFLIKNANQLLSLSMDATVKIPIELPNLLMLKELNINNNCQLPLLTMCKETLECLVYCKGSLENIQDYFVIPQLTSLYIRGCHTKDFQKLMINNHMSLEFLFLSHVKNAVYSLGDEVKMEQMKLVVLRSDEGQYRFDGNDKARMAKICPNADVYLMKKEGDEKIRCLVKSYHKRKGFTTDIDHIFLTRFQEHMDKRR